MEPVNIWRMSKAADVHFFPHASHNPIPPVMEYDYSSSLLSALESAKANATVFERQNAQKTLDDVASMTKAGAINGKTVSALMGVLPLFVSANTKPLREYGGTGPTATAQLVPQVDQGLHSWYWSCTQFFAPNTAVFVVLSQITVDPATNLSVWFINGTATTPGTGVWVQTPVVFLEPGDVVIDAATGTTTVTNPQVNAVFKVSLTGCTVSATWTATGFSVTFTCTTARGPVYEQARTSDLRIGPVQSGYWSIVDGVVTNSAANSFTPGNGMAVTTYSSGVSWLDYQQFGIKGLSKVERYFSALTPSFPHTFTSWMFLTIQDGTTQISCSVLKEGQLRELRQGKTVHTTTASVWSGTPNTVGQHNLPVSVQVLATVPGGKNLGQVPVSVLVTCQGKTYKLVSYSTTLPVLIASTSVTICESPCIVNNSSTARGVIEWFVQNTDEDAIVRSIGLPTAYVKHVTAPSQQAILAIVMAVLILGLVISVICVGVESGKRNRQAKAKVSRDM